jgi:phosphatidylserine/phosphatidylglycerophosphate/cardiolipin synthase-like enzyme
MQVRTGQFVMALCCVLASCRPSTPARSSQSPSTDQPALTAIALPAGYGSSRGWFELYFTDPRSSLAAQQTGGADGPLSQALDGARLSIDVAAYSLSLNSIRDALLRAHHRGVQVRMVMESDNRERSDPQKLMDAGISILGDRRQGLMHDKFIVIDRSELWTGSMNFTDSGAYEDNNNLIRLRSREIAENYSTEFDEMFVEDKFGPDAVAATPHPRVTLAGTPLDFYFSPDDRVAASLLDLLDNARESIYFLAYSFTSDALGAAIRERAAAGVTVEGVMDTEQVQSNLGTEFDAFRAAGLDVRLDGNPGLMHHKVMIIDESIVVTGSYNFTNSAEASNDENVVVIYDRAIAGQFLGEFRRVFAQGIK